MAEGDLQRYRKRGPNPTTRLLRDGILRAGAGETVLDIGAGIGALSFELLTAGVAGATAVDAVPAYVAAARQEAARRGQVERLRLLEGDFVALADQVPAAEVVALDRVVCCYPAYQPLLEQALARTRRLFAYSYPRDRWYVRLVVTLQNFLRSLVGNTFRTFVHPAAVMGMLVERHRFRRVSCTGTLVWSVDIYARKDAT